MIARTHAALVHGTQAAPLTIEAEPHGGSGLSLVGVPERAARECYVRVRSALRASALKRPHGALVRLLPEPRHGVPQLDLAIALATLCLDMPELDRRIKEVLLVGELSLDGRLRPVRGLLPMLLAARDAGLLAAIVPRAQLAEAKLVDGITALGADTLVEVVAHLRGDRDLPTADSVESKRHAPRPLPPVRGLDEALRALGVAAKRRQSVLLVGPFGSCKTMLARRVSSMMSNPTTEEAREIAVCQSAAGVEVRTPIQRPFRAPHHTASIAALLGGGHPVRPGEITLAHEGVLFLDEVTEFRRDLVRDVLRATRDGQVTVHRRSHAHRMPAKAMVIAAMTSDRHRGRVPLDLFDLFDVHVKVPSEVPSEKSVEST